MSASLKKVGFQVIPVDSVRNQHQQRVRCIKVDLTRNDAWSLIDKILSEPGMFYVHASPPCGTASRARDKAVPLRLIKQGFPNPQRLRSESEPWGLEKLDGVNLRRVESANSIYVLISRVIARCIEKDILLSIENPWRSYFWFIPVIAQFLRHPKLVSRLHHVCMLGGDRNKLQRWLVTKGAFPALDVLCDGGHWHKPWSMRLNNGIPEFDTEGEAEFPTLLCEVVTDYVLQQAISKGFSSTAAQLDDRLSQNQARLKMAASLGKQPRGRKLPQLVSEFLNVSEVVLPLSTSIVLKKSQQLLRSYLRDKVGEGTDPATDQAKVRVHIVGTRRTPAEFHEAAMNARHPYQPGDGISEEHKSAIFGIFTKSPMDLAKLRIHSVHEVLALQKTLADKERLLHESFPPHARKILDGKNLLLFRELLTRFGYQDVAVVQQMIDGVMTIGRTHDTGLWEKRLVPATMTEEELRKNSVWIRESIIPQIKSSGDDHFDRVVWEQTIQEEQDGWLSEPISKEHLDKKYSNQWLAIPRFGIKQGNKIRGIDDCKRPELNQSLTTTEKLRLQDVDYNAALCLFIGRIFDFAKLNSRLLEISLSDGTLLKGSIHADWGDLEELKMQGRTLDLKSAYKNLFNHPECMWASIIAVWCPESRTVVYRESFAMMFGATSSVFAFNRVAKALQFLAGRLLRIIAAQFYDDFPCYEPSLTSRTARLGFEALLSALGWKWATGEKAPDFGNSFSELGVVFNLSELCSQGELTISNKPSRISNIVELVDSCVEKDWLPHYVASELAGKLQFSGGQFLGDFTKAAMKKIRDRACSKIGNPTLTREPGLLRALDFVKRFLVTAPPRTISCKDVSDEIIIYSDGASESDGHNWGVVIFGVDAVPIVAGGSVPSALTDFWLRTVGSQIICQVEFYPVLLTKALLGDKLRNRKVTWYIDNDPVRDSLISGSSDSPATTSLLYSFCNLQMKSPSFNWFARVPSYSNHADAPSRHEGRAKAKELGGTFEGNWVLPDSLVQELFLTDSDFENRM